MFHEPITPARPSGDGRTETRMEAVGFLRRRKVYAQLARMTGRQTRRDRRYVHTGTICLALGGFLGLAFGAVLVGDLAAGGSGWNPLTWFVAGLTAIFLALGLIYFRLSQGVRQVAYDRAWPPRPEPEVETTGVIRTTTTFGTPAPFLPDGAGRHFIDVESRTRVIQRPSPSAGRVEWTDPGDIHGRTEGD
jgi:hypothetical protein